ncbi:MAG TPA: hypothetical protein VI815_02490 [Candidatus Nanoarchaeia archaeon]|nr:hypothetical protein [Candidatus Nanoarchaeia archaeon]
MAELTQQQIDSIAETIKAMDQYTLCRNWRFAPSGTLMFRKDLITSEGKSLGDLFSDTLKEKGGFTSEISKELGW